MVFQNPSLALRARTVLWTPESSRTPQAFPVLQGPLTCPSQASALAPQMHLGVSIPLHTLLEGGTDKSV